MSQLQQKLTLPAAIANKLDSVRRRTLRVRIGTAIVAAIAVLLAAMAVAMFIDWLATLYDFRWRALLTYSAWAAAGGTLLAWILVAFRHSRQVNRIAAQVDREIPELEERWSTVTTLSAQKNGAANGQAANVHPAMFKQVSAEAQNWNPRVEADRVVPLDGLIRALLFLTAITSILGLAVLFDSQRTSVLMKRFWQPYQAISSTELINITDRQVIGRGESLQIEANLIGAPVQQASLLLELGQGEPQNITLIPRGEEQDRLTHRLRSVKQPLRYRLRAGDGQTEWFDVVVVDRPQLANARLTLTPPAYTRKEPKVINKLPRRVTALEGSRIEIAFKPKQDLQTLQLKLGADRREQLTSDEKGWYRWETTLTKSFSFQPLLTEQHGLTNLRPPTCEIKCRPDKPPVVKIITPNSQMAVRPDETVPVTFVASDDVGVYQAELVVYDEGTRVDGKPIVLDRIPVPLGEQQGAVKVKATVDLDLSKYKTTDGSELSFSIRVREDRGQTTPPNNEQLNTVDTQIASQQATTLEDTTQQQQTTSDTQMASTPQPAASQPIQTQLSESEQIGSLTAENKQNNNRETNPNNTVANNTPIRESSTNNTTNPGDQEQNPQNSSLARNNANQNPASPIAQTASQQNNTAANTQPNNPSQQPNASATQTSSSKSTNSNQAASNQTPNQNTAPNNASAKATDGQMANSNQPAKDSQNATNPNSIARTKATGRQSLNTANPKAINNNMANRNATGGNANNGSNTNNNTNNSASNNASNPTANNNNASNSNRASGSPNNAMASNRAANKKSQQQMQQNATNQTPTSRNASAQNSSARNTASQNQQTSRSAGSTPAPPQRRMNRPNLDAQPAAQSSSSNRLRLKIDEWAGSYAGQQREKLEIAIAPRLKEIDLALEKAQTLSRSVLDEMDADNPWVSKHDRDTQRADKQVAEAIQIVEALEEKTYDTPYAFVGLQLVDINQAHISPARRDLWKAMQTDDDSRVDSVRNGWQHITRARELIVLLTERFERTRAEYKTADTLQKIKKMYQIFAKNSFAMLSPGGEGNRYQRKIGEYEDLDEELLKRLEELAEMRNELQAELARILADDPQLLRRYLDQQRNRNKVLRNELDRLIEQQNDLNRESRAWAAAEEEKRPQLATILLGRHVESADELAITAADLYDNFKTWSPLGKEAEDEDFKAANETLLGIATATRELSEAGAKFVKEQTRARKISDSSSAEETTTTEEEFDPLEASEVILVDAEKLYDRFTQLEVILRQIGNREGNDEISSFAVNRLLETRRLVEQTSAWIRQLKQQQAGNYHRSAEVKQYSLALKTDSLATKLADVEQTMAGLLRNEEGLLPQSIAEKARDMLTTLDEQAAPNQLAAVYALRRNRMPKATKNQQSALEALERAGKLYDEMIEAAIIELDKLPLPDPTANNNDPTLDQLLRELEREVTFRELLGIPGRRTNLRIMGAWLRAGGDNSLNLGGNGNMMMNQMRRQQRMRQRQLDQAYRRAVARALKEGNAEDLVQEKIKLARETANWNKLASQLQDDIRQGADKAPPERYRPFIDQYFRQLNSASAESE